MNNTAGTPAAASGPVDRRPYSPKGRTHAAQELVARAFAFARERGMQVYFAVHVDSTSANPQELIMRLPPEARLPINVPAMIWMG